MTLKSRTRGFLLRAGERALWPPFRPVCRPLLSGDDPLLPDCGFMKAASACSARSRGVSSGLVLMFLHSSHLHLSVHFTCALPTNMPRR